MFFLHNLFQEKNLNFPPRLPEKFLDLICEPKFGKSFLDVNIHD